MGAIHREDCSKDRRRDLSVAIPKAICLDWQRANSALKSNRKEIDSSNRSWVKFMPLLRHFSLWARSLVAMTSPWRGGVAGANPVGPTPLFLLSGVSGAKQVKNYKDGAGEKTRCTRIFLQRTSQHTIALPRTVSGAARRYRSQQRACRHLLLYHFSVRWPTKPSPSDQPICWKSLNAEDLWVAKKTTSDGDLSARFDQYCGHTHPEVTARAYKIYTRSRYTAHARSFRIHSHSMRFQNPRRLLARAWDCYPDNSWDER